MDSVPSVGVFLRDPSPYLREFRRKSERLDRQARPGIELGTYRLPVFERSHWWSQGRTARHPFLIRDSNPEPLVQQMASLTTAPFMTTKNGDENSLKKDTYENIFHARV